MSVNKIGRKVYYELNTGKVVRDIGEKKGYVIETSHIKDFPNYNPSIHGVIELSYGERVDEFTNLGTYEVVNNQLVIYPKVVIQSIKETILNDGIDTAIITATVPEDMTLVFTVFGTDYSIDTVSGVGLLEVVTEVAEVINVSVAAGKFGNNSVSIKGVETIA